jgi:hypothetical protein
MDDSGRSAVGVPSGQGALMRLSSPTGTPSDSNVSGNTQRRVVSSRSLSKDRRKSAQPSTWAVGEEWQTAHKRWRTLTRRGLAERSVTTRRERATKSGKPAPGDNNAVNLEFLWCHTAQLLPILQYNVRKPGAR